MRARNIAVVRKKMLVGIVTLAGLAVAGCGGLDPVATYQPTTDPTQLYARLAIPYRAINMSTVAPYDTLQLSAVPLDALGGAMTGLPTPSFHLLNINDTSRVAVTSDGLVKARTQVTVSGRVGIVAELALPGNVRHADTAWVAVIATPPPSVASLAYDAVSPDSARQGMALDLQTNASLGGLPMINALFARNIFNSSAPTTARVLDTGGNPITGILVEYTSLAPAVADITLTRFGADSKPRIQITRPGQVGIVASTMAFGTARADTLPLTTTWPVLHTIRLAPGTDGVTPTFQPSDIVIAPYGIVWWQSVLGDSADVTFDDATNVGGPPAFICDTMASYPDTNHYGSGPQCGTGNLELPRAPVDTARGPLPIATTRVRQFPVPGVYTYHSARTGATGRIIVTDDPDPAHLP